ncbi:MAG: hypothetical protein NTY53_08115 [Kiritimatiellaeota bacterium]|nr:hypothetical protein [Kiritimatiellota bacterium]
MALLKAMPTTVSSFGAFLSPVISMYWKPWNVKRGCQTSVPLPDQM